MNLKSIFLSALFVVNSIAFAQLKGDQWSLVADSRDQYFGLSMANGKIGIVTAAEPLRTKDVLLNGIYDANPKNGISKLVRGIEFLNVHLSINNQLVDSVSIDHWTQQLFMKDGISTSSFQFKEEAQIKYSILANRVLPYSAMAIIEIMPLKDIEISAMNFMNVPQEMKNAKTEFRVMKKKAYELPLLRTTAQTTTGKWTIAATTTFLFDGTPETVRQQGSEAGFTKKLLKGEYYRFVIAGGICNSKEIADPVNETERQVIYAFLEGMDKVITNHKRAWSTLWESGDIEIGGDLEAQQRVRFALYNLYSYIREGSRQSISPMGLSSQGYNGHIFWDTELWMYPPLLVLQPQMAISCLDYRADRLQKAKLKAFVYGYKGAMYPWESDDTGEEATPTAATMGVFEQHITSDVSIAFWNYYALTQDKVWLRASWDVLRETADFWLSRVTKNDNGSYSILNVVGADEYALNVDDNAFTNASTIEALKNTIKAAQLLNEPVNPKWIEVAENLLIERKNGITQNYKGYKGQLTKQADVNLLAYPLHIVTEPRQIKADLDYYAAKIDQKEGPAMTYGVLSVLYARLGDRKQAYDYFVKSYLPYSRGPFGVFSESASSNNPYFATGAGAMLQAVLFGFGGIEQTDQGLKYNKGLLPEHWTYLKIKGVGTTEKTIWIK